MGKHSLPAHISLTIPGKQIMDACCSASTYKNSMPSLHPQSVCAPQQSFFASISICYCTYLSSKALASASAAALSSPNRCCVACPASCNSDLAASTSSVSLSTSLRRRPAVSFGCIKRSPGVVADLTKWICWLLQLLFCRCQCRIYFLCVLLTNKRTTHYGFARVFQHKPKQAKQTEQKIMKTLETHKPLIQHVRSSFRLYVHFHPQP